MLATFWASIVKNAYVVGAAALAILTFVARLQFLKNARDKAELKADTLKATVHAERVRKKIVKEKKKEIDSRREDIIKEIKKEGEDFEGVDNFTDSNNF